MQLPSWGDHAYDLLYKTVENLEPFVSTNYQAPVWGDHFYDLLLKLNNNLANITASSGGTPAVSVATPADENDFSVLPGGVIPTGDAVYFADRDLNTLWTISKSDTEWKIIDKSALP